MSIEHHRQRIAHLGTLEPNWDGYRGDPIKSDTVNNAIAILEMLGSHSFEANIFPMPNGTIAFEWDREQDIENDYATLEVGLTTYSFCALSFKGEETTICGKVNEIDLEIANIITSLNSIGYKGSNL